jgi:hypothetical protein
MRTNFNTPGRRYQARRGTVPCGRLPALFKHRFRPWFPSLPLRESGCQKAADLSKRLGRRSPRIVRQTAGAGSASSSPCLRQVHQHLLSPGRRERRNGLQQHCPRRRRRHRRLLYRHDPGLIRLGWSRQGVSFRREKAESDNFMPVPKILRRLALIISAQ